MGAKRRSLVELRLTVVIKSGIKRGLLGASDPLRKYSQLLHRLWLSVECVACARAVLIGATLTYIGYWRIVRAEGLRVWRGAFGSSSGDLRGLWQPHLEGAKYDRTIIGYT